MQFHIEEVDTGARTRDVVFSDWSRGDRFGIVINDPLGGVGASHLIQLAICAFYGSRPECRTGADLYPEIYAFHLFRRRGSHADYDFWPPRRETVVSGTGQDLLDAILDRGVTRLALPEVSSPTADPDFVFDAKEVAALRDRLSSAFVYSSTGRVRSADFSVSGLDRRTEINPQRVLNTSMQHDRRLRPVMEHAVRSRNSILNTTTTSEVGLWNSRSRMWLPSAAPAKR